ncbi:Uracil-DNA glycosylase superfamily [Sulfurimonas autotrophica DSM 16294]|uniref:Uracil-DNA glycosylase superfamily n=1 Tax=Sulfurimonas autotrophica (strain ATCC BAA-671 / DSM 16294 / JCM 11897 / OK10) TaxID=563040 RepID=E0UTI3_SULAO|nr:Uracil-DNA glycosylase superfamily [Sulfurimonas autotrophica DSM 16294]
MVVVLKSYQNLVLLQNLYRLKAMGFEYIEHFNVNDKTNYEKPNTLEALAQNIASCHLCDLSKSRTQSMSGYGSKDAKLVIIDYSVSQAQDSSNSYYAGRSGETLKNMIEKVLHLSIDDIYLTHAVKCKPLQSNKPSPSEYNSCKNYLFSQLDFIKPKVIVTLGEDAYTHITGDTNFENVRGHVIDYKEYKLIPIYHPQYLLRNPHLKKITLNDLKTIKSCLQD